NAHGVVTVKVGLLDAAVLDGTFPMKQGRQTEYKRACYLPLDLGGIDCMAWIGRRNDAMDLDLFAVGHGNLSRCRDVGAKTHRLRYAARNTLRRRLGPTDFLRNSVEDREVFRVIRHQFASEFQRVLPRGMGEFIHEAFKVDR